jgi:hypothetical protein
MRNLLVPNSDINLDPDLSNLTIAPSHKSIPGEEDAQPQGPKPNVYRGLSGTAKAVSLQNDL